MEWFLGALLVILTLGLVVWLVRRRIRLNKIAGYGWSFTGNPGPAPAYGLNCPPFGVGDKRRVRGLITGQHQGVPFRSFRYTTGVGDDHVLVLPLPRSFPELYLHPRAGVTGLQLPGPGSPLVTIDESFARAIAPALQQDPGFAMVIDGAALVLFPVPDEPEELYAALSRAVALHRQLLPALPRDAPEPPVPPEMSVFRRPEWIFRQRDDAVLTWVRHSGSGGDARRVLSGIHHQMQWVALTHHWTTTHTSTDSEGRTQTRTQHHYEDLFELRVPPGFGNISVNRWHLLRAPVEFESIEFNERFKVRADNPRFAHDVIHPRMMGYLTQTQPPPLSIEDGVLRLDFHYSHEMIEWILAWAAGFFAWVPSFVWDNLGYTETPTFGPRPEVP